MGTIFDNHQIIAGGNTTDFVHVHRVSPEMGNDRGLGSRGRLALKIGQIDIGRLRVNVDEYGLRSSVEHGADRSVKGKRGNQDPIAFYNVKRKERGLQARGSIAKGNPMFTSDVRGKVALEIEDDLGYFEISLRSTIRETAQSFARGLRIRPLRCCVIFLNIVVPSCPNN